MKNKKYPLAIQSLGYIYPLFLVLKDMLNKQFNSVGELLRKEITLLF